MEGNVKSNIYESLHNKPNELLIFCISNRVHFRRENYLSLSRVLQHSPFQCSFSCSVLKCLFLLSIASPISFSFLPLLFHRVGQDLFSLPRDGSLAFPSAGNADEKSAQSTYIHFCPFDYHIRRFLLLLFSNFSFSFVLAPSPFPFD